MTNILDHDDHACAGMKGTPTAENKLRDRWGITFGDAPDDEPIPGRGVSVIAGNGKHFMKHIIDTIAAADGKAVLLAVDRDSESDMGIEHMRKCLGAYDAFIDAPEKAENGQRNMWFEWGVWGDNPIPSINAITPSTDHPNQREVARVVKLFTESDMIKCLIINPKYLKHGAPITGVSRVIWLCNMQRHEIYAHVNARLGFPNTGISNGEPYNTDAETNSPKENTND